ncbi:MAG: DedA family protein, partial [Vulcanimicrobiaceae bacterium]
VEQVAHFFLQFVDAAGYPGLFVVMMLGNIGMPVGTEFVAPTAGALVATGHLSSVWLATLVAVLGEVAGAGILYTIGYFGGLPFVDRYGKYLKLDRKKYDRLHAFYERHGAKTVFICRFIPVVRGVASLPAGVSRMSRRFFFLYTAAGSAFFCGGLVSLGHSLGAHLDEVAPYVHRITTTVLVLIALVVAVFVARAIVLARRSSEA